MSRIKPNENDPISIRKALLELDRLTKVAGDHHKTQHQDGGTDEISVAGLSGELADVQKPKINGQTDIGEALADGDEVAVYNLSGTANRKSAVSRIWTYIWAKIVGLAAKNPPIDADSVVIIDSADGNAGKLTTWTQVKAFLKTYLDTLYEPKGVATTDVDFSATSKILGRVTASAGKGEELTLTQVLDLVGSAARGDILYRGDSAWSRLAKGTEGYYLKAGANDPEWAAVSTGLPRNYLTGLGTVIAADADHDITIAVGKCRDSSDTYDLVLSSPLTKRIDASWAAGDNNGGLFTGSVTYDAVYHLFLIRKDSDGSIDAGWDTSVTCANIPAGYTAYRRIWSMFTDGSSNILAYEQNGDWCTLSVPYKSVDAAPGMAAAAVVVKVPTGLKLLARLRAEAQSATPNDSYSIREMYVASGATYSSMRVFCQVNGITVSGGAETLLRTDTSAQVRHLATDADVACTLIVNGWVDSRGRDD